MDNNLSIAILGFVQIVCLVWWAAWRWWHDRGDSSFVKVVYEHIAPTEGKSAVGFYDEQGEIWVE